MVDALYHARKKKGMTQTQARDLLRNDVSYFGTMMMMQGMADGMVSGACHSTANTMRPALQLIKMAPGYSLVSSVFFMLLKEKVYVYGGARRRRMQRGERPCTHARPRLTPRGRWSRVRRLRDQCRPERARAL